MIRGLGTDIVEIERIKKSVEKHGESFLNKVFTPHELKYSLAKADKYQHLAGRFAAKEAVAKALSDGNNSIYGWHNVEIVNESNGMPVAVISEELQNEVPEGYAVKISISHSDNYATAVAIVHKVAE